MTTSIEAPPLASQLIESMRDIGYHFETALADVIDNSISAGAKEVHIHVDANKDSPLIGIVDDGEGMTRAELLDAMRLGSRHPKESRGARDLGRFGLGMKTASFSQCRRLTVVSRREGETAIATWDLDHVAASDSWSLLIPASAEGIPFLDKLGPKGSLVLWERLDRVMEREGSDLARKQFVRRVDEASRHLELVFHRYLAGESGARLSILVNALPLSPFDPFHLAHSATIRGVTERVPVNGYLVEITPFTLPHHRNVTPSDWDRYGGPEGYLKNQGFYLYRQRRLILYGTWFGLARHMELTKLTRVRIDIPTGLDEEWQIDVKKASARPPLLVRERLSAIIREIGAPSIKIFRKRAVRLHDTGNASLWSRVLVDTKIHYQLNLNSGPLSAFASRLPEELRTEFTGLLQAIGAALPLDAIFVDLAGSPEDVTVQDLTDQELTNLLTSTVPTLTAAGIPRSQVADALRFVEPFRSHWDRTEVLIESLFPGRTS